VGSGVLRSTADIQQVLTAVPGARQGVAVPFQFPFTGEDHLRLTCLNVVPSLTVALQGRYLREGESSVSSFVLTATPTSTGEEFFQDFAVGRCVMLNLVARSVGTRVRPGECFVRVDVVRGDGGTVTVGTMLSGYLGSWGGRAWPGSELQTPLDGRGFTHVVQGAVPAVGVAPFVLMPALTQWRLIAATSSLQTDAVAGARGVYLTCAQDSIATFYSPSNYAQPAGTLGRHNFGPSFGAVAPGVLPIGTGAIPHEFYLVNTEAQFCLVSLGYTNAGPADQWDRLTLLVEEWRNAVSTNAL
jgi:hypothetical protein